MPMLPMSLVNGLLAAERFIDNLLMSRLIMIRYATFFINFSASRWSASVHWLPRTQ